MKEKVIPVKQRKYLLRVRELIRRGLITFNFISRRTCLKPVHKLRKSSSNKKAKKGGDAKGGAKKEAKK
jgi:hypothetical protein